MNKKNIRTTEIGFTDRDVARILKNMARRKRDGMSSTELFIVLKNFRNQLAGFIETLSFIRRDIEGMLALMNATTLEEIEEIKRRRDISTDPHRRPRA